MERTLITIWLTDRDSLRLEFKLADLWIGVFWKKSDAVVMASLKWQRRLDVWLCLLPCLPVHLQLHYGKEKQVS